MNNKETAPVADICLLLIDAVEGLHNQDLKIATLAWDAGRSLIIVVNKWDKYAGTMPTEKWVHYINDQLPGLRYAPIAFITGQTVERMSSVAARFIFSAARL